MKKRLTRQDIDKLSKKERKPLKNLPGLWRCDDIPLMTIGDMIEYLGQDHVNHMMGENAVNLDTICDSLWITVQEKANKA